MKNTFLPLLFAASLTQMAKAQDISAIRNGFAFDDTMTAFLQSYPNMIFDTAHYGCLPDTTALAIEGIPDQSGVNIVLFDSDSDGVMSEDNITAISSSTSDEKDRIVIKLYWSDNENTCRVFKLGDRFLPEAILPDDKLATFEQKRQKYAAVKP